MSETNIEKVFRKRQEISEEYAALMGPGPTQEFPAMHAPQNNRIQESFDLGQRAADDMAAIVTGRPVPSRKQEK